MTAQTAAEWLQAGGTRSGDALDQRVTHILLDGAGQCETSDYIMLLRPTGNLKLTIYFWNFPCNISGGTWLQVTETVNRETVDKELLMYTHVTEFCSGAENAKWIHTLTWIDLKTWY